MPPSVPLLGVLLLLLNPARPGDPAVEDVTGRAADFGTRLYRDVAGRTDDNVLLSPFAVSTGLLALLNGAGGATQEQLLQGLTLMGTDPQNLPDVFQSLRTSVLLTDPPLNLKQGVAVFANADVQMPTSYLDAVRTKLGGGAQTVPYAAPYEAADAINRWVQEQTGDQVQELLSPPDPQTQLLLAAVAAYHARFDPPFNSSSTQDERFYVDKYHVTMVPMMFRADKYFLAYDRSTQAGVLKLPMTDGAAMLAVLPDEDVDVGAVEEEVTSEKIKTWIRQLKKTKLEVQLPRFAVTRSYALRDALQSLGITQVFQDDADLSSMGGAKGFKLTQVHHKSVVSADESSDVIGPGGGVNTSSSPPPRLTFNRPFIFIIYQETTGALLFMGRVANPTQT